MSISEIKIGEKSWKMKEDSVNVQLLFASNVRFKLGVVVLYMPYGDRCVPHGYAVTQYYTCTIVANQIKYFLSSLLTKAPK